jgi:hypothetical protein
MRPSDARTIRPSITGRRESRVPVAPAASRAKLSEAHERESPLGSPGSPGLPCAMVLTAYFVLSPAIGLVCHRHLADTSAKLDAGVEASGPHDFAVRVRAIRQRRHLRPPHPIPTFVTMANAPPRDRTAGVLEMICPTAKAKYFCKGDWTAIIRLIPFNKLGWSRKNGLTN